MEDTVLADYGDDGFVVWALAHNEDPELVAQWVDYFDITIPVMVDVTGSVKADYPMPSAFPTAAYPQQWLIGKDGTVRYINNRFDHALLSAAIERALAE
jgi:hypothetical protein